MRKIWIKKKIFKDFRVNKKVYLRRKRNMIQRYYRENYYNLGKIIRNLKVRKKKRMNVFQMV
jgi:hypothetical protein